MESQFSTLNDDVVRLQMDLDEQTEANTKLQAQLQKAATDAQQLKSKYEKDITIITEELEDTKSVINFFYIYQIFISVHSSHKQSRATTCKK